MALLDLEPVDSASKCFPPYFLADDCELCEVCGDRRGLGRPAGGSMVTLVFVIIGGGAGFKGCSIYLRSPEYKNLWAKLACSADTTSPVNHKIIFLALEQPIFNCHNVINALNTFYDDNAASLIGSVLISGHAAVLSTIFRFAVEDLQCDYTIRVVDAVLVLGQFSPILEPENYS